MSNLEIGLTILSGFLLLFVIKSLCAYSEQYDEVEELKRINNCLELERTFRKTKEEDNSRLHIRIRQLECNADSKNVIIEGLKDRIDTSEKIINGKDKIIEALNAKIVELQNQIDQWFTPKVSKNDVKDNKPSLVKSFKKREPIIKAFRYNIDDPDYLKQKLEELDAKCLYIDLIDGYIKIKALNYSSGIEEEHIVANGDHIVREDSQLKILSHNNFRKLYEEE